MEKVMWQRIVPQLPRAHYEVDVPWESLEFHLDSWKPNLDPDFQRAHVWTQDQQIAYIEYILQGGEVGRNVTFNGPRWMKGDRSDLELVDGKQRVEAVRAFLRDEFTAFGRYAREYGGLNSFELTFRFRVCTLKTREELLRLYLNINAGGTPHTEKELDRVRKMLKDAEKNHAV